MTEQTTKEAKGNTRIWIDIMAEFRAGHSLTYQPADRSAPPLSVRLKTALEDRGILRRGDSVLGRIINFEVDEKLKEIIRVEVEPVSSEEKQTLIREEERRAMDEDGRERSGAIEYAKSEQEFRETHYFDDGVLKEVKEGPDQEMPSEETAIAMDDARRGYAEPVDLDKDLYEQLDETREELRRESSPKRKPTGSQVTDSAQ